MNILVNEYNIRIEKYTKELKTIKKNHLFVSLLRLFLFFCIVLSFTILYQKNHLLAMMIGVGLLVLFVLLIKKHKQIEDKKLFCNKLLEVNEQEKLAHQGMYDFFDAGKEFVNKNHPYSFDIDLFGKNSLFQYLNRTSTFLGKRKLAEYLSESPDSVDEIKNRQDAVKELAILLDFRQKFISTGKIYISNKNEVETIKKWFNLENFFNKEKPIKILIYTLPIVSFSILLLVVFSILSWKIVVLQIIINLLIISLKHKKFKVFYNLLNQSHKHLKTTAGLLKIIEQQKFETSVLKKLRASLFKNGQSANLQIKKLSKFLEALDHRNNILIGLLLNGCLLWDWQCVYRIEHWKKNKNGDFENWLKTIAHCDSLISLANFTYNHSDFCYPEFSKNEFEFSAKDIGHPLLSEQQRVCNDFELDSEQRYAIITGANMAGKSTFLRTIAINLVLAYSGTNVCAKKLKIKPLPIFSGMRTEDSLSKNESYFFAELKRLQQITRELENGKKMFIILDEILRGTNSEDKRKGSIGFMDKIVKQHACGLIATHDLELANLAKLQPNTFKTFCFEVSIENDKLNFSYKLQNGVTKNMNASFLMKKMGIIDN